MDMPLEDLIRDVESKTESRKKAILKDTDSKVEQLNREKDQIIAQMIADYGTRKANEARKREETIIDKANIEARIILRDRIKAVIDKNIEMADEIIANIRKYKDYRNLLNDMIAVSVRMLGNDCIINVDDADKGLVTGSNLKYGKVDEYGGILSTSKNGDIEIDLRISKIIGEINERMRTKLYSQIEG